MVIELEFKIKGQRAYKKILECSSQRLRFTQRSSMNFNDKKVWLFQDDLHKNKTSLMLAHSS